MFRLTDAMCRKAGPGRHSDGRCLHLFVRRTGTKSWVFRRMVGVRRRDFGLGAYPDVSLAEARELAAKYRSLIRKGVDPRSGRSSSAPTVREAFEAVIGDLRRNWTAADAERKYRRAVERHIYPLLGGKRVDEVTVDDCYAVVHPKWHGRGSLGFTVRHQISHLMRWAVAHGYRDDNPAELVRDRLPKITSRPKHQPSLPYSRMREARPLDFE